ncbi:hypothetical protein E4U43_008221 [Claviceps pusilla]|uniref:Uncharacterized protein n=1 Tax=Claviceps pusilla TaxID=123648 RepID=A0A9P7NBQ2_9HYPO|nr:hypothetical protein E4U43_008221 [Claviceps pusilla]
MAEWAIGEMLKGKGEIWDDGLAPLDSGEAGLKLRFNDAGSLKLRWPPRCSVPHMWLIRMWRRLGGARVARMARIHELEMLRQEALHKTESITRDEEARLLQLRILTIRDENADLRDEIGQRNHKIGALTRDTDQLRLDLAVSQKTIREQNARLKKQDIDLANLKAEMEAMNLSMSDTGKLLQEKFALTRELERLKPELEHLQSQLTTLQATVAEKNDLRRQLDAVEAELENEKRSRQRLQSKNNDAAAAELACRLEEAEENLATERRDRDKMKRELEKQVTTTKAENERLEERISGLKDKTKGLEAENERLEERICSLKDEAKGLQAELKEAKDNLHEARSELAATQSRPVENEQLEKRLSGLKDKTKGLEAENERLEERICSLKDKAKGLQAELKEAKDDLHEARSELAAAQSSRTASRVVEDKPKKATSLTTDVGRKRRAPVMSFEEITIQTPGNDTAARERPAKKRGSEKVTASVGEKSVFSITPFLNRNKSLLDDAANEPPQTASPEMDDPSPPMSDEPAAPEPVSESEAETPKPKASLKTSTSVSFKSPAKAAKAARPRAVRQAKATTTTPLGESTPGKANRAVKPRGTPKIKSIPEVRADKKAPSRCVDSTAVPDQENVPIAASRKTAPVLEPKVPDMGIKKRKRKLLGGANTTLFDEDDEDDGEAPMASKPQPTGGKRTRARLGGGVRNAFAAGSSFSPLKRDRRGVNASFLG